MLLWLGHAGEVPLWCLGGCWGVAFAAGGGGEEVN